jgi:hypothetical protein
LWYVDFAGDVYFGVNGASNLFFPKWDHATQQIVELYQGSHSSAPSLYDLIFDDDSIVGVSSQAILRMPTTGGTFSTLVPASDREAFILGSDPQRIYFYRGQAPQGDYIPSPLPAVIETVPKAGGGETYLVQASPGFAFATDDKYLYWVGDHNGPIQRWAKTESQSVDTLVAQSAGAYAIAVDSCNVYWLTRQAVMTMSKPD